MTEIKAVDCKTFWKRSTGEIITYTEGTLMDIIQLARKDILSLITTIESQKEEIKRYNELFQEIGIMCAFEQPPQILRILAVLQKFQQKGEK